MCLITYLNVAIQQEVKVQVQPRITDSIDMEVLFLVRAYILDIPNGNSHTRFS